MGQVKEGYSLGEQLDEIEKFCNANGFNLIDTFRDEGISGAKEDEDELRVSVKSPYTRKPAARRTLGNGLKN